MSSSPSGFFYRGHDVPACEIHRELQDPLERFSSTSVSPGVGQLFGGGGGGVFKLKVLNAKNVQPFSWFGGEEGEMLLNPNMEFVVTKKLHKPATGADLRDCEMIEMQQIPDDTVWS